MHYVDKPIGEKNKGEIERKLNGMGDFVKMSYLQRALNSRLDFDTKKFVMVRLAGIYESRKMFLEAARLVKNASEINTTTKDKITDFLKSVNLYIKGGDYETADAIYLQSLSMAIGREKEEVKKNLIQYYLTQAKVLMMSNKRNFAKIVYEKMLTMELNSEDKKDVQNNLLNLYDKLGCVRDYYELKRSMH